MTALSVPRCHQRCLPPIQVPVPTAVTRLQQQSAGDALSREICAHDAERRLEDQTSYPSFTTAGWRHQKAPAEVGELGPQRTEVQAICLYSNLSGKIFTQLLDPLDTRLMVEFLQLIKSPLYTLYVPSFETNLKSTVTIFPCLLNAFKCICFVPIRILVFSSLLKSLEFQMSSLWL